MAWQKGKYGTPTLIGDCFSCWEEILDITCECLANSGLHVSIDEVTSWHESLGDIHAEDPPLIEDVQGFLKYLKSHGILISVCTSDDRGSTNACLRNWQIEHLVDYSICGDEVTRAKPSPHPLLELCGRAGVLPEECLVVGDTSADMGMGVHGRAGLVVGVLTGFACTSNIKLYNGILFYIIIMCTHYSFIFVFSATIL